MAGIRERLGARSRADPGGAGGPGRLPRGRGRRPPSPPGREPGPLPRSRAAAGRDPALARRGHRPERAARPDPARGPRPDHDAEGGGRPARAAAGRLRHLPVAQRRRLHRRVHRRPQAARQRQPVGRPRRPAQGPGGHAQRGPQRRRRAGVRAGRRGRHAQGDARRRASACSSSPTPTRSAWSGSPTRCATETLRAGDSLLLDTRSGYVYERIPKSEVEELVLEEVPDIDYENIGGLRGQIEQIRDAVELPYLHPDLFKEHELKPPKGVLLYGPPGLRQDADRQGGRQLAGQEGRGEDRPGGPARTSSTSRAPSCSTSTSARPSGTSGWCSSGPARRPARAPRSSCSSTRWTRCSAPAAPASPPTSRTPSSRSCSARSTVSRGWRTSWSSAPPTART